MEGYEEYLSRLKGRETKFDGDKLYLRIEAGVARQTRRRGVACGALVILLLGLVGLNVFPYFYGAGKGETLADYLYQQEPVNGDQIINYVYLN
jgi:hypothetical protein